MVRAVACADVPKLTVVVGGSFGAGNYGQHFCLQQLILASLVGFITGMAGRAVHMDLFCLPNDSDVKDLLVLTQIFVDVACTTSFSTCSTFLVTNNCFARTLLYRSCSRCNYAQ